MSETKTASPPKVVTLSTRVRYYVAARSSIIDMHHQLQSAHTELKIGEHITQEMADEHIRSGYLREVRSNLAPDEAPGLAIGPAVPKEMDLAEGQGIGIKANKAEEDQIVTKVSEISKVSPPRHKPTGKWIVDPNAVGSKSLEELNVMVLERDQDVVPFDTKEEAIAQLSADFKGK